MASESIAADSWVAQFHVRLGRFLGGLVDFAVDLFKVSTSYPGEVIVTALMAILVGTCASARDDVAVPKDANSNTPLLPILRLEGEQHSSAVRRISVDEARSLVVSASDDKTARVWDLKTGGLLTVLRPPLGTGERGRLYGVAIHPRLPIVAIGGTSGASDELQTIYLFDTATGRMTQSIRAGVGAIKRLRWSPDGSVLLAGSADWNGLRGFDSNGDKVFEMETDGAVYGIAVSPSGRIVVTDLSGKIHVLRGNQGRIEKTATWQVQSRRPISAAMSPDESAVVVGYQIHDTGPDIVDLANGKVRKHLAPTSSEPGHFGAVAWSVDGRTISVAGTASKAGYRYPIWSFAADTGRPVGVVDVADNSILDLAALTDGRVVFASFDSSWGVASKSVEARQKPTLPDLRGSSHLRISADAHQVSWTFRFGSEPASFDFNRRVIQRLVPRDLRGALLQRNALDKRLEAGFEAKGESSKRYSANLNGIKISFGDVELASCGTYFHAGRDAILGTTKALYRYDERGRLVWRQATESEIHAVVVSDDDRVLVTALAEGIIQWRRPDTGVVLLSLLALQDGRWVLWSPEGYYDASVNAERLLTWVVNQGPDAAAIAFPVGRFRDRYRRPDIVDRVLSTLDPHAAIAQAPPSSRQAAMAIEHLTDADTETAKAVQQASPLAGDDHRPAAPPSIATKPSTPTSPPDSLPPPPSVASTHRVEETVPVAIPVMAAIPEPPSLPAFPPALTVMGALSVITEARTVDLPFGLLNFGRNGDVRIEVRLNGRPYAASRIAMPAAYNGTSKGTIAVDIPTGTSTVQFVARSSVGYSEPLSFTITAREAAPTTSIHSDSFPPGKVPVTAGGAAPAAKDSSGELIAAFSSEPKSGPTRPTEPSIPEVSSAPTAPQRIALPTQGTLDASMAGSADRADFKIALATPNASPPSVPVVKPSGSSLAGPGACSTPPAMSSEDRPPGHRTLYLLSVGVSEYRDSEYNLSYAAKDARDFANTFRKQAGRQYGDVIADVVTDNHATKAAILHCLRWLATAPGKDDVAILFLAGHGVSEDTGQYYFLGHDAEFGRVAATAVAERDIRDALRQIRGRSILFVDTCHAGNVIGNPATSRKEMSRLADELASAENGVVVFAASSGRQLSSESDEWGNGAFTKAIIEGLSGEADLTKAGRITFKSLDFFVSDRVSALTDGFQTPVTIVPVGIPDFVMALIR